jgi:hypothetical protein
VLRPNGPWNGAGSQGTWGGRILNQKGGDRREGRDRDQATHTGNKSVHEVLDGELSESFPDTRHFCVLQEPMKFFPSEYLKAAKRATPVAALLRPGLAGSSANGY